VAGGAELGIASATMGLIMASLLGGPIAKHLIEGRGLKPSEADLAQAKPDRASAQATLGAGLVTHVDVMRSLLAIHLAIAIGVAAHESLLAAGLRLPTFVPCLLAGILLSNTVPLALPRVAWPARSPALALVSELALAVFLSMSLMSMQLWTLAAKAGPRFVTMAMQAAVATAFILFVVFPAMGRSYFAAVISAGFTGVTLGATPTAVANMDAVTRRYGPAPLAFILLPLVSAFFVDIVNAFVISFFLGL
jgi:ESS family glutamate:Na+ symporter